MTTNNHGNHHRSNGTHNGSAYHGPEDHNEYDEPHGNDGNDEGGGSARSFEESCQVLLNHGREDFVSKITSGDDWDDELDASLGTPPPPAKPPREPRIRFYHPGELRDYQPAQNIVLAGNCHIMRGEVFVMGGEAGVGKSRAATALAVAGAFGGTERGTWFGLRIAQPFRTMIIQAENGRYRLQQEYSTLDCAALHGWVRVSEPPPFGITLSNSEFMEDIRAELERFQPDCVILDPWNAAARDDKQRDYAETFTALRNMLPTGERKPALGIVAHTRKPQPNEQRIGGTGLANTLAGSHMLTSVPRCVFIMTRASEQEGDDRVIWFNPKNNNGEMVTRTAWHRGASGFTPEHEFDWEAFEKSAEKSERKMVTLEHLQELFESCDTMELAEAVERLTLIAEVSKPTAYGLLNEKGRFSKNLVRNGKMLSFRE